MSDKEQITVDGKPLQEWLDDEKAKEAREHRAGELINMKGMVYNRAPVKRLPIRPDRPPCRVYSREAVRRYQLMSSGSLTTSTRITFVLSLLKEWDGVQHKLRSNGIPVTVYPTPGAIIKYMEVEGQENKLNDSQIYSVFKRLRRYLVPAGYFEFQRPQYIPTKLFHDSDVEDMARLVIKVAKGCQGKHVKPEEVIKREIGELSKSEPVGQLLEASSLSEEITRILRNLSDVVQEIHIVFKTRL